MKQEQVCFNCIQCVQWQSRSCLSEKARQLVWFWSFRYWTDLLNIFVNLARDGCVGEPRTLIGYLKTILDWYFMPGSANITLRGKVLNASSWEGHEWFWFLAHYTPSSPIGYPPTMGCLKNIGGNVCLSLCRWWQTTLTYAGLSMLIEPWEISFEGTVWLSLASCVLMSWF